MSKSVVRPHCSKSHRSFFITTQTLTSGAKSYTLIRKSEKDWDAQHCSESKMSFSLLTCMFSNSITQKHNMQCTTYQEEEKKKKKLVCSTIDSQEIRDLHKKIFQCFISVSCLHDYFFTNQTATTQSKSETQHLQALLITPSTFQFYLFTTFPNKNTSEWFLGTFNKTKLGELPSHFAASTSSILASKLISKDKLRCVHDGKKKTNLFKISLEHAQVWSLTQIRGSFH